MTLYHHCQDCPEGCKYTGTHTVPCDYCAKYGGQGTEPMGDAR